MEIKEKILNQPLWKTGLYFLACYLLMSVMVEWVAVHSIFSFFHHTLNRFEQEKKEDLADLNDHFDFGKGKPYDQAKEADEYDKKLEAITRKANLPYFCDMYRRIQEPLKTNHQHTGPGAAILNDFDKESEEFYKRRREEDIDRIKVAIEGHEFIPSECPTKVSP